MEVRSYTANAGSRETIKYVWRFTIDVHGCSNVKSWVWRSLESLTINMNPQRIGVDVKMEYQQKIGGVYP